MLAFLLRILARLLRRPRPAAPVPVPVPPPEPVLRLHPGGWGLQLGDGWGLVAAVLPTGDERGPRHCYVYASTRPGQRTQIVQRWAIHEGDARKWPRLWLRWGN